jgi:hypothetical protein
MTRLMTRVLVAGLVALGMLSVAPSADAARRDRKAPRVAISAPTASSIEEGVVNVLGTASDNVKVAKVVVGIDGQSFTLASGRTSWSLPVNSELYADGTHAVTVKAYDKRGNVGKASVDVVFENGTPASGGAPSSTTTSEGTQVFVDSDGPWTAAQIAGMLQANGLDSTVGPRLTVRVQDTYASQVVTSTSKTGTTYTSFTATMYLKGVNSQFASYPDATLAHELGHVWSLYHYYMSHNADWSSYLQARGLEGDPRLDTNYQWGTNEIIAEDYRILFGTAAAVSQRPHLNSEIPDPRNVAGLREFLENTWAPSA